MSRVLCVAAHPDDEVLGVGGTLLRHQAEGSIVHVVLAYHCRDESEAESHEAERRMGLPYERLWETGRSVDEAVASFAPDIVYTHSLADLHHEHRTLHERVLVACRPQSGVQSVWAFETPSATDWGMRPFEPLRFVDISRHLGSKLEAMGAYVSELRPFPHPRNLKSLKVRAQSWGQRAGFPAAEAFEVIRECW